MVFVLTFSFGILPVGLQAHEQAGHTIACSGVRVDPDLAVCYGIGCFKTLNDSILAVAIAGTVSSACLNLRADKHDRPARPQTPR